MKHHPLHSFISLISFSEEKKWQSTWFHPWCCSNTSRRIFKSDIWKSAAEWSATYEPQIKKTSLILHALSILGAFGLIVSFAAKWFGYDWSDVGTHLANFIVLNAVCVVVTLVIQSKLYNLEKRQTLTERAAESIATGAKPNLTWFSIKNVWVLKANFYKNSIISVSSKSNWHWKNTSNMWTNLETFGRWIGQKPNKNDFSQLRE